MPIVIIWIDANIKAIKHKSHIYVLQKALFVSYAALFTVPKIARANGSQLPDVAQYVAIALKEVRVANYRGITYEIHGCTRQGGGIICSFLLTINFDGNEYYGTSAQIGNSSGNIAVKTLIDGITMKASISFNNIPKNVNNFAILDISLGVASSDHVRFDNVSLYSGSAKYTSTSNHNCDRERIILLLSQHARQL